MSFFKGINEYFNKISKSQGKNLYYYFVLIIVGLVAIVAGNHFIINDQDSISLEQKQNTMVQTDSAGKMDFHQKLEKRLQNILSQIDGVGNVEVMITLVNRGILEPMYNTNTNKTITEENDNQGGTRYITETSQDKQVVTVREQNSEKPLLIKEELPEVRGVIVVAQGAGDLKVKKNIIEAVKAILDVPSHKIKVLVKKNN